MNRDPNALSAEAIERFGSDPLATFSANLPRSRSHRPRLRAAGRERAAGAFCRITKTVPAHILDSPFGLASIPSARTRSRRRSPSASAVDLAIDWCIVGHLQTNKVKYLTRFATEFHALDSLRLADLLNARLEREIVSRRLCPGQHLGRGKQVRPASDALLPFVDMLDRFPG